jgi:hypothetical protein
MTESGYRPFGEATLLLSQKERHMPEPDKTELSEEQKQIIIREIQAKWTGQRTCPICGTDSWVLAPHLTTPQRLAGTTGGLQIGGTAYPTAMLVCSNCGFVHHFNAVVLHVVAGEAAPMQPVPPEKKEAEDGH